MADLRINPDSQLSFLNGDGAKSYLFVTTQKNLLSFLSSGMITPSASQFRYRSDSRELSSGAIPFWKGGIPASEDWKIRIRDKRSVVIEYSQDYVEDYMGKSTVYESDSLVVVNAPVPIIQASSIYMSSEDAIEDFLLRVPGDVVFDRSLFNSRLVFPEVIDQNPAEIDVTDISSQVEIIDSFAGGVRGLSSFLGEDGLELTPAIPAILTFLNILSLSEVKWSGKEVEISPSDQMLLNALIPLLTEHKEENGFDPMSFLSGLEDKVRGNVGSVPEDLVKWFFYVRALVNAEKEVKPLSDEGDVIQRAVLLFILRPSLERLQTARDSSASPGLKVLTMALFFAGCATGATRMAAEFKGDFHTYTRYVKSVIDAIWNKSRINARLIKTSAKGKGPSVFFEVNGEVLIESEARQDPVLARVMNQARSLGYEINYDLESDELIYEAKVEGKAHQVVYIERLRPTNFKGLDVIRFISPCLHLSASKMRSLKKAQLLELLFSNDRDGFYCSYALSEKRKSLVVEATQIVNTMVDDEFVTILNHVSNTAAKYE